MLNESNFYFGLKQFYEDILLDLYSNKTIFCLIIYSYMLSNLKYISHGNLYKDPIIMESRNGFWKFQKVDFKVPVLVKKKIFS